MARNRAFIAVMILLATIAAGASGETGNVVDGTAGATGVIVGTFDSRAVAAAYYRSTPFNEMIAAQMAEYEAALAEGDSVRAEELSDLGESMQEQAHSRVFGTGDVDEIIWEIYAELPSVAEEAAVDVIVSIWDVYYRAEGVEYVDVTDLLVLYFDPSEETLELVEQMRGMPAIPSQLLTEDH